jgi:hypothetical protein
LKIREASVVFNLLNVGKQSTSRRKLAQSGTDVKILKIVSPKIFAKKLAFLNQNKAKL